MNGHIRVILLALSGWLFALCAETAFAGEEQPVVLAIIVGVTNYAENRLEMCDTDAKSVANAVRHAFKGADVREFISDTAMPPTRDAVEDVLLREVPALPPHSVVIFYFAGHGLQLGAPGSVGSSDLGMVMENGVPSSEKYHVKDILTYSQLMGSIKRTRMANFIVVLDCCYAGADGDLTALNDDNSLSTLGVRGLVIAAALRQQKTIQNVFTQSLVDLWAPPAPRCMRPADFIKRLQDGVTTRAEALLGSTVKRGWLAPRMVLGDRMQACMGIFGTPSTYLFIRPPDGQSTVFFEIGNDSEEEFRPGWDTSNSRANFYVRQVAKSCGRVLCRLQSGEERIVDLKPENLDGEILWVDFRQPKGQELHLVAGDPAIGLASDVAYDLGARDHTAFELQLARLESDMFLGTLAASMTVIAAKPYDDVRWRVLAGEANQEETASAAASAENLRLGALLNWSGRSLEAARLLAASPQRNDFIQQLHALVTLRLLNEPMEAAELASQLWITANNSNARAIVEFAQTANVEQLRASVPSLPTEWTVAWNIHEAGTAPNQAEFERRETDFIVPAGVD